MHGSTTSASFLYNTSMHASMSVRVYACANAHVSACRLYTGDYAPRIFLENTSLRLQSVVKLILAIILHLSLVHPSMHVSVSVCACMHVSVHNIMCSAGPEVAVLDWYGPEADPVYW